MEMTNCTARLKRSGVISKTRMRFRLWHRSNLLAHIYQRHRIKVIAGGPEAGDLPIETKRARLT